MENNNSIRDIDINFLHNPSNLNKKVINNNIVLNKKSDLCFYKKRLHFKFKEMLKELIVMDKSQIIEKGDIYIMYNSFLNHCIHHFKNEDKKDILQDQFREIDITENTDKTGGYMITQNDLINNIIEDLDQKNILEKMVDKKKLSFPQEEVIYPIMKKVNLKTTELKYKGIKYRKKKNLGNIYEDKKSAGQKEFQKNEKSPI